MSTESTLFASLNAQKEIVTAGVKKEIEIYTQCKNILEQIKSTLSPVTIALALEREDLIQNEIFDSKETNKARERVQLSKRMMSMRNSDMEEANSVIEEMGKLFEPGMDPVKYYNQLQSQISFIEGACSSIINEFLDLLEAYRAFIDASKIEEYIKNETDNGLGDDFR